MHEPVSNQSPFVMPHCLIGAYARIAQGRRAKARRSRCSAKELDQVERGIKRCLDFIAGGDGDPGLVRDKLQQLEGRRDEITHADTADKPLRRCLRGAGFSSHAPLLRWSR